MRSINKVILVGNLTRDPEMKTTTSGQVVTTFGLATNRRWTNANGENEQSTEFHECAAWAKLAEQCNNLLKKGKSVYIEGGLRTRSWELPDGSKKFRTEVVASRMILLDRRGDKEADFATTDETVDEVVDEAAFQD